MAATVEYDRTLEDISKTMGFVPGFFKGVPIDALPHVWSIFKKYEMGTSLIPQKYKEMIGLAVAAAIKCPYCEIYHRSAAKMYGATDEELNEVALLTGQVVFWSAVLHAQKYDYDKFVKELESVAEYLKK
ncbi:MAG: carboxymuconolactone decarboxylase family protein [Candidatus Nitrosocaldus sp.]